VILETPRLILRSFREEDLDLLAPLMANPDFMRFSLGVYSREQTAAFLDKVINWQRFGLPTQFAVIHGADNRLIGYCGFLHQQVDATDEIEIAYGLTMITGAEDWRPKRRRQCAATRFAI